MVRAGLYERDAGRVPVCGVLLVCSVGFGALPLAVCWFVKVW